MWLRTVLSFLFALSALTLSNGEFTPNCTNVTSDSHREKWGFANVRPGAYMFWWLHLTTHADGYQRRPLIIWLQGGPGLSSSGLGNFAMFGPEDTELKPRNTTWLQSASLLFVDNPVGTGFSYVDTGTPLAKNIDDISDDLLSMLKAFLTVNCHFKTVPIYIFGQSYGGKMAVGFAHKLEQEISTGSIDCQLKGIGIGNGWVSPVDFIVNWAPLLLRMSLIDDDEFQEIDTNAQNFRRSAEAGYSDATTSLWFTFGESVLEKNVNLYNILEYHKQDARKRRRRNTPGSPRILLDSIYDMDLEDFMNGHVRTKLQLSENVIWKNFSPDVYTAIEGEDFLRPVVDKVDKLLKTTNIKVVIYEGQLDLVCTTQGAIDWTNRLTWPGLAQYHQTERKSLYDPISKKVEMFVKSYSKFHFYWILNAGHVVPSDAPEAALRMLNHILDDID